MESKLIHGDSLEKLKELDDNSVDMIATDPPYAISFMGKEWDKALPNPEIFEECLRVLKPGGFTFVMSAPRSDVHSRMCILLEDAGFNIGFTPIAWAYATGFPKSLNISRNLYKSVDKVDIYSKLDGSYAGYQVKPAWESVIVCMKPIEKSGYVEQAKDNAGGITWLDDCRIPFAGMNDKEQFDKDNVAAMMNFDGEYEKGEGKMHEGGWKKPNREGLSRGNQPSRKPKSDYDKYVEKQESFKGAKTIGEINEGGRTFLGGDMKQLDPSETYQKPKTTKRKPRAEDNVFKSSGFKSENNDTAEASPMGRFPANLLIQDDMLNTGKTTKSTGGRSYQNTNDMYSGGWSGDDMGTSDNPGKGDEGDFSRYFSLDEWWKRYFNKLPEEVQRTFPFLIIPKASKREKDMGLDKGKFSKVEYELDDGVPDVILKDIENHLKKDRKKE